MIDYRATAATLALTAICLLVPANAKANTTYAYPGSVCHPLGYDFLYDYSNNPTETAIEYVYGSVTTAATGQDTYTNYVCPIIKHSWSAGIDAVVAHGNAPGDCVLVATSGDGFSESTADADLDNVFGAVSLGDYYFLTCAGGFGGGGIDGFSVTEID